MNATKSSVTSWEERTAAVFRHGRRARFGGQFSAGAFDGSGRSPDEYEKRPAGEYKRRAATNRARRLWYMHEVQERNRSEEARRRTGGDDLHRLPFLEGAGIRRPDNVGTLIAASGRSLR